MRLAEQTVVVAGGTGNVGSHVVRALLEQGATVVVPSRSEHKLLGLREFLGARMSGEAVRRLVTLTGSITDESAVEQMAERIASEAGQFTGVVATLGNFVAAPSLLQASPTVVRQVLDSYTVAHFMAARVFLPGLLVNGGKYVFVNGPLAFQPWRNSGSGLVSVATAAQHMLFRSVAQEYENTGVEVKELVTYAFVRNRETQPGSALRAESVGEYIAYLLSDAAPRQHGETIHLRSENDQANLSDA